MLPVHHGPVGGPWFHVFLILWPHLLTENPIRRLPVTMGDRKHGKIAYWLSKLPPEKQHPFLLLTFHQSKQVAWLNLTSKDRKVQSYHVKIGKSQYVWRSLTVYYYYYFNFTAKEHEIWKHSKTNPRSQKQIRGQLVLWILAILPLFINPTLPVHLTFSTCFQKYLVPRGSALQLFF